ncbi:MAG: beta-aspartyl-peptidase [Syntrophomonas sp.]|uniref:beta-aspartyl-peptidase n=1 Tax=Syntrophomonas sp. TaxID=2053627 RepID=UPI00260889EE|nr:beta-aspartyl-peptidase [Syntrophomonas sp.]MDD4626945.1 beta-aspartyl-peptidase [Syntrophomonas sp.]
MFKLLKNGHCFAPDDMGIKDILLAYNKICDIKDKILPADLWDVEVIDCQDCLVCPGIIDQHVHITGGGGEQGPISRIPEIMFSKIVEAGVTTVVGVLGFDSITRSIAGLLAKARGLEAEGITTYIYTGSYGSPTETLTGRVLTDIALLDKVIGVGEIAIADYRSNHPSLQDLRTLASEANAGGMLGAKAGVLHLHVGDGEEGLQSLFRLVDESDFPISMFVPTHINRNATLFDQGIELLKRGGQIDLTAGETKGYSVAKALAILAAQGINLEKVTVSSDGNGSAPNEGGINNIGQLLNDIRACVLENNLQLSMVIKTVTLNPARVLKIYPQKGCLLPGSDADILILRESDLSIYRLLARGQVVVEDQKAVKKGKYEN